MLLALLAPGTQVAGVFTTSKTASDPVLWCRDKLKGGEARVESGGRSMVLARERKYAVAPATAANLHELLQAVSRAERSNERARFARDLLRIVFAAYESASTGETVWLGPRATA